MKTTQIKHGKTLEKPLTEAEQKKMMDEKGNIHANIERKIEGRAIMQAVESHFEIDLIIDSGAAKSHEEVYRTVESFYRKPKGKLPFYFSSNRSFGSMKDACYSVIAEYKDALRMMEWARGLS